MSVEENEGIVVHIVSPEEFYVMPTACLNTYASIQKANQAASNRPLDALPQIDEVCLAEDGAAGLQRAKLEKISPDSTKVKIFFLDSGRRDMRPAPVASSNSSCTQPGAIYSLSPSQLHRLP
jgi:hypothetical protein